MADTLKRLYGNTLSTSNTTLYTVPSATKTIVSELILTNKTGTDATATILFNGVNIIAGRTVKANNTLVIGLHSLLEATNLIEGSAGTGSAIDVYISGIEVA